jgi:CHRD domain
MAKSKFVLATLVVTAGFALVAASAAQAHPSGTTAAQPAATGPVFFAADLSGKNEVGPTGTPGVGDPDGHAIAVVRIQGTQVSFAIAWRNIAAPTAGHIHVGAAGVNGGVVVPFFGGAVPAPISAITGTVMTTQATVDAILANPAGFYSNLHTPEFPAGAVRGQLRQLSHPVDLQRFLQVGTLISVDTGDQEIAGGDADGHGTAFVQASGSTVRFGFSFAGIAPPSAGHIHQGAVGVNGPVVVPFFSAPGGLPMTINGIAGTVTGLDRKLVAMINRDPRGFYTNLHNADFPGGAIRGQLFRLHGGGHDDDVAALAADAA